MSTTSSSQRPPGVGAIPVHPLLTWAGGATGQDTHFSGRLAKCPQSCKGGPGPGGAGERQPGRSGHAWPSWASRALFIIELPACSSHWHCRLEPFDVIKPLEKGRGREGRRKGRGNKGSFVVGLQRAKCLKRSLLRCRPTLHAEKPSLTLQGKSPAQSGHSTIQQSRGHTAEPSVL